VSKLRFATPRDGWAFAPGLWSTHDGGAHWARPAIPEATASSGVLALETDGRSVFAFVSSSWSDQTGSGPGTLVRSPVSTDDWTAVPGVRVDVPQVAALTLKGSASWLTVEGVSPGTTSEVVFHSNGGMAWTQQSPPCGPEFALAALSETHVIVVCGFSGSAGGSMVPKKLYGSNDGGLSYERLPDPPATGDFEGLSYPASGVVLIADSTAGGSSVQRTRDGSRSWNNTLSLSDEGEGWADLGFTDLADGVVVHAPGGYASDAALYESNDGGVSWRRVVVG